MYREERSSFVPHVGRDHDLAAGQHAQLEAVHKSTNMRQLQGSCSVSLWVSLARLVPCRNPVEPPRLQLAEEQSPLLQLQARTTGARSHHSTHQTHRTRY
jgi:hypothetical protein